jgi:Na+/glutamate symporter
MNVFFVYGIFFQMVSKKKLLTKTMERLRGKFPFFVWAMINNTVIYSISDLLNSQTSLINLRTVTFPNEYGLGIENDLKNGKSLNQKLMEKDCTFLE